MCVKWKPLPESAPSGLTNLLYSSTTCPLRMRTAPISHNAALTRVQARGFKVHHDDIVRQRPVVAVLDNDGHVGQDSPPCPE